MTNDRIWAMVCTTDPAHTKHVPQRGGFTAIDAYSQIQEATKVFGPVGEGWGWTSSLQFQDDSVIAKISLWYREGDVKSDPIEVYGCSIWTKGGKTDTDAPKKAVTDGITKALSYLGFNADVFLGAFDGNKYTAPPQKAQAAPQPPPPHQPAPQAAPASVPPEAREDDWELPQEIQDQAPVGGNWMMAQVTFGKHKGSTWNEMCDGSDGGGRAGWLEWLGYKVNPWLDRDGNPMKSEKYLDQNLLNCARARACLQHMKGVEPATTDELFPKEEVPF